MASSTRHLVCLAVKHARCAISSFHQVDSGLRRVKVRPEVLEQRHVYQVSFSPEEVGWIYSQRSAVGRGAPASANPRQEGA